MQISLENSDQNAVQAYGDNEVKINSITYTKSLIVSKAEIITDVKIQSVKKLDSSYFDLFMDFKPEVIIIGHSEIGSLPPVNVIAQLSQLGIGLECMSLGAACRTFNILLSEERRVLLGIIFN